MKNKNIISCVLVVAVIVLLAVITYHTSKYEGFSTTWAIPSGWITASQTAAALSQSTTGLRVKLANKYGFLTLGSASPVGNCPRITVNYGNNSSLATELLFTKTASTASAFKIMLNISDRLKHVKVGQAGCNDYAILVNEASATLFTLTGTNFITHVQIPGTGVRLITRLVNNVSYLQSPAILPQTDSGTFYFYLLDSVSTGPAASGLGPEASGLGPAASSTGPGPQIPGSWSQSCSSSRLTGNILTASCQTGHGTTKDSSINVDACSGLQIHNYSGDMWCKPEDYQRLLDSNTSSTVSPAPAPSPSTVSFAPSPSTPSSTVEQSTSNMLTLLNSWNGILVKTEADVQNYTTQLLTIINSLKTRFINENNSSSTIPSQILSNLDQWIDAPKAMQIVYNIMKSPDLEVHQGSDTMEKEFKTQILQGLWKRTKGVSDIEEIKKKVPGAFETQCSPYLYLIENTNNKFIHGSCRNSAANINVDSGLDVSNCQWLDKVQGKLTCNSDIKTNPVDLATYISGSFGTNCIGTKYNIQTKVLESSCKTKTSGDKYEPTILNLNNCQKNEGQPYAVANDNGNLTCTRNSYSENDLYVKLNYVKINDRATQYAEYSTKQDGWIYNWNKNIKVIPRTSTFNPLHVTDTERILGRKDSVSHITLGPRTAIKLYDYRDFGKGAISFVNESRTETAEIPISSKKLTDYDLKKTYPVWGHWYITTDVAYEYKSTPSVSVYEHHDGEIRRHEVKDGKWISEHKWEDEEASLKIYSFADFMSEHFTGGM